MPLLLVPAVLIAGLWGGWEAKETVVEAKKTIDYTAIIIGLVLAYIVLKKIGIIK